MTTAPRYLSQIKIAGTKSFRISACKLFGYGGNATNQDKETLDIIEAPPGYNIVSADQAGAEALIVAYLAEPGRYRELFTEGIKPHIYVALHLFISKFCDPNDRDKYWLQRPSELRRLPNWSNLSTTIAKSKYEYDIGKMTGHAKNYRMGPNTFRESALRDSEGALVLSFQDAKFFLDTYALLFPEIILWQNEIESTIRAARCLRNLFGFPRRFERIITDGYVREAISWIPQSTVGCITHAAYLAVSRAVDRDSLVWRLFNNKHDSFAVYVPVRECERAAVLMSNALNQRLVGRGGVEFTMKSEVKIGRNMKNWSENNPGGLKEYKI